MAFIDILIILIYFVIILSIGILVGKKEENIEDFIVGNRQIPWIAVLLSIIATEISAATFLNVPGTGYTEDYKYVQMGLGSLCARFLIAFLFIPVFYKYNCLTVYEYLANRFGELTRYLGSILFFITRLLGSGVRLLIAATGISIVMGWDLSLTIIIFALISIIYTAFGGIKAIVWTDVVQALIFIGCGIGVLVFIIFQIPGGISQILDIAQKHSKLVIFKWTPTISKSQNIFSAWLNDSSTFFLAFFNGLIITLAAFGTDQDITQRMLTCKDYKKSQKSIIFSGLIGIPVMMIFLFVGTSLFSYYKIYQDPNLPNSANKIFSYFIKTALPVGLKGFLIIGIFAASMSSLDSALGALSSSSVIDIYKPLLKRKGSEKHYLLISRINVIIFGILLALIAILLRNYSKNFLWLCFKIVSIPYGALLGIFLLGIITNKGDNLSNFIGIISSILTTTCLLILIETDKLKLGWTWLIFIGTFLTFFISYVISNLKKFPKELIK